MVYSSKHRATDRLRLLIALLLLTGHPGNASGENMIPTPYADPQPVVILNLPLGSGGTAISTEEPFISRDGSLLFFNSAAQENNKDLHFARWISGEWHYSGEIGPGINTITHVEGNPTMDLNNQFFFVDSATGHMIRTGLFTGSGGEVASLREFTAVPERLIDPVAEKFHGNMGVEVSADGDIVFFSRATWPLLGSTTGTIEAADLAFVIRLDEQYVYDQALVAGILENINTADLEYAASLSADKLELYFTRLAVDDLAAGKVQSVIMRASRPSPSAAFSPPVVISAIGTGEFVEGPAISADGRELYYHQRAGDKFRLYKVTRNLIPGAVVLSIIQAAED